MPSRLLKDLEPVTRSLVVELFNRMRLAGYPLFATCTLRTFDEQAAEYAKGRDKPGRIVTFAKPGQSPHNYGMAADVCFVKEKYNGPWDLVGKTAKAVGLVWGGEWKKLIDKPHVERPNWRKYIK